MIESRVVTSGFFSDLSTLNSLSDRNQLLNWTPFTTLLTIHSSLSTAIFLKQGRVSQFLSGNLILGRAYNGWSNL